MKQERGEVYADWTLQGLGGPEEVFSHLPKINETVSKYFKRVCVCVCVCVCDCGGESTVRGRFAFQKDPSDLL